MLLLPISTLFIFYQLLIIFFLKNAIFQVHKAFSLIIAAIGVLCILSNMSCFPLPHQREPQSWICFYHSQECLHILQPIFNKEKNGSRAFFLWWVHKHPVCIRTDFLITTKRDTYNSFPFSLRTAFWINMKKKWCTSNNSLL